VSTFGEEICCQTVLHVITKSLACHHQQGLNGIATQGLGLSCVARHLQRLQLLCLNGLCNDQLLSESLLACKMVVNVVKIVCGQPVQLRSPS
jgi:hypothetical protein